MITPLFPREFTLYAKLSGAPPRTGPVGSRSHKASPYEATVKPKGQLLYDLLGRSPKKSLLAAQKLFSTILELGFTANPKLALRAQTVGFATVPPR